MLHTEGKTGLNIFAKTLIWLLVVLMVFNLVAPAVVMAQETDTGVGDDIGSDGPELANGQTFVDEEPDPGDIEGFVDTYSGDKPDFAINKLRQTTYDELMFSPAFMNLDPSLATTQKLFGKYPIEINNTDKSDLEKLYELISLVPDFDNPTTLANYLDLDETGLADLEKLYFEDHTAYHLKANAAADDFDSTKIKELALNASNSELAGILNLDESAVENLRGSDDLSSGIDDLLKYQIDKRVIQTLNYLVRPKDDPRGGAGHWHVKVSRIVKGYDTDAKQYSRESLDAEAKANKSVSQQAASNDQTVESYTSATDNGEVNSLASDAGLDSSGSLTTGQIQDQYGNTSDYLITPKEASSVISAHNSGQALDISELDDIKCTLVQRKRIGNDKKTAKTPIGVKFQWQSNEGYSSDASVQNSSFNDMFLTMSKGATASMLADLNIDLEDSDSLKGANFSDMASVIGQAFLSNALDSTTGDIWKFDLQTTLRKMGGMYIADNLQLERQPFMDTNIKSIDGLSEAIGRYFVEQKLNLPYGALAGQNRSDMFISIAKARIAQELGLPSDSLNFEAADKGDLYQHVGARIVEDTFGFTKGSFFQDSLPQVKEQVGKYRYDLFMSTPEGIDDYLGLNSGTTRQLKNNKISPKRYDELVAQAHFATTIFSIPNTTRSDTDGSEGDLRDEMASLPEGTIAKFLANTLTTADLVNIAQDAIAKAFETRDEARDNFKTWLQTPTADYSVKNGKGPTAGEILDLFLPMNKYAEDLKIPAKDIYRIFGQDGIARGVYKQLGEMMLAMALAEYTGIEQKMKDILNSQSSTSSLRNISFYTGRINEIQQRQATLSDHKNKLTNLLRSAGDMINPTTRDSLDAGLVELIDLASKFSSADPAALAANSKSATDLAEKVAPYLTDISERLAEEDKQIAKDIISELNAVNYDVTTILRDAIEIFTGKEQTHFRIGDLKISDIKSSTSIDLGGIQVSLIDIVLFFSGKISSKDFAMNLASAKLGSELHLPPKAFKYAAIVINKLFKGDSDIKSAFFRAFAVAQMEDSSKQSNLVNDEDLGSPLSVRVLRDKVRDKQGVSEAKANEIVAASFGLDGYNLEYLMRGDFGAWASARPKAEANDSKTHMPRGTTEKFIKGEPLGDFDKSSLSDDEVRQVATAMHISESAIRFFIAARDGQITPTADKIYFVDHNSYMIENDTYKGGADTGQCAEKVIPDNSYVYYDKGDDGKPQLHTFATREAAERYKKDNSDKVIDYISEIEYGFAVLKEMGDSDPQTTSFININYDFSNLDSDLRKFVSDNKIARIFPVKDEHFTSIEEYVEDHTNVTSTTFDKIFTRNNGNPDTEASIDFLKVSGYYLLKNFAISYLNDALGIEIGPNKLTPDDIVDIFSGNGKKILSRIGSEYLDQEMDLTIGTTASILDSRTTAERNCNLMRVASQLLGNALGIKGLDLNAFFSNDGGRKKIENMLGFPTGTFKGDTLEELVNSVPILKFYQGFNIPVPKEAAITVDATLKEISDDFYKSNKYKSFYDKAKAITAYLASSSSVEDAKYTGWHDLIDTRLKEMFFESIQDNPGLWSTDESISFQYLQENSNYAGYSEKELRTMWRNFFSTLSMLDAALDLDAHTTANLLSKTALMTPNKYIDAVQKKVVKNNIEYAAAQLLINQLGLEDQIKPWEMQNFFRSIDNGSIGTDSGRASAFTFLCKVFSLNFDSKAGFAEGTFARIVANPRDIFPILLEQGASKLDNRFGISTANVNFTRLVHFWSEKPEDLLWEDLSYCSQPGRDFDQCMDARSFRTPLGAALAIGSEIAVSAASDWLWKYFSDNSSVTMLDSAGNPTGKTKPVVTSTTSCGPTESRCDTGNGEYNKLKEEVRAVLSGDMRPLVVFTIMAGIADLIGDEKGNLKVDKNFLFSFEDIYMAIYGDPELEEYAAAAAEQNALDEWNFWASDGPARDSYDIGGGYSFDKGPDGNYDVSDAGDLGAPIFPGAMGGDGNVRTSSYDDRNQGRAYLRDQIDYQYGTTSGYTYTPGVDKALDAKMAQAEGDARSYVKRKTQEYYQYKVMDCMLHKVDPNIPVGFSYAVFKLGGYSRTLALVSYLNNAISKDDAHKFFGDAGCAAITNFISGPAGVKGNIDTLLLSVGFDKIDQYLGDKIFGGVLFSTGTPGSGIGYKTGTAKELFNFIKTGSLDGLKSIYGGQWVENAICGWTDTKLGLPTGMSRQIYEQYKEWGFEGTLDWMSTVGFEKIGKSIITSFLAKKLGVDPEDAAFLYNFAEKLMTSVKISSADIGQLALIVIKLLFAKQLAAIDQALGLVPGSMMAIVSWGLMELFSFGDPIAAIVGFILMNLFGVYKVEYICTADGYYPVLGNKLDSNKWDVANLGPFNGMNQKARKLAYIDAAQYKANKLIEDLYEMPARTGDEKLVPLQVMTGRQEDVDMWKPLLTDTVCKLTGGGGPSNGSSLCDGWNSRAGMWANPQTVSYTHIGF